VALESGAPTYSTTDHSGYWRHFVIREGKHTGETMVNIVTAPVEKYSDAVKELADQLIKKFPDITTAVHTINSKKAQVAIGDEERVLFGPGTIREKIGDRTFQISAGSFFQTNTRGAEMLYQKVAEFADLSGNELIFDLYSGAGTIAIFLAERAEKVIGFEMVDSAVQDARKNCKLNGVENCSFIVGDLKDNLTASHAKETGSASPQVMIIDPPRAGMHGDVLQQVLKLGADKIIYVSCNPTTFARDAYYLCQTQYELQTVQPVDMFPMTSHIEMVGLLTKQK